MNPITIHVTDECLATLRNIADQRGATLADLLDSAMEPDMLRLLRQLGRAAKKKLSRATNNPNLEAKGDDEKLGGKIQKKIGDIEKVFEK